MKKFLLVAAMVAGLCQAGHALGPCGAASLPITWKHYQRINGIFLGGDYSTSWPNGAIGMTFTSSPADVYYLPLDWDWAQHVATAAYSLKKNAQDVHVAFCYDAVNKRYLVERINY